MTELESALIELAAAKTALARIERGGKPGKRKPKQRAHKSTGQGHWRTSARTPDESKLVRVLPAKSPARASAPVVTMHLDPTNRPTCAKCALQITE
jgi:hypothetical protein